MIKKKILQIVFHNGSSDGIRICTSPLSTIKAFVVPRSHLNEAKYLVDIKNPGIYYLFNQVGGILTNVFIGQTKSGIASLENHIAKNDYWNNAILFLDNQQHFTLDMISRLEEYAIRMMLTITRSSRNYEIDNLTIPQSNTAGYNMEHVVEIYAEMEFTISALGFHLQGADNSVATNFAPKTANLINQTSARHEASTVNPGLLVTRSQNVVAFGLFDGKVFELQSESEINFSRPVHLERYNIKRQDLLKNGAIIRRQDGRYFLAKPVEFDHPSEASSFALGGSSNGWIEWRDQKGMTLDELMRKNTRRNL